MEYIYAVMLLHKAGKKVDEANLSAVLKAAGVTADDARVKATVAALKDVDIDKAIAEAKIGTPVASAPSEKAGEEKPAEEKKESKEDEAKTEEEAAAGLGALFG